MNVIIKAVVLVTSLTGLLASCSEEVSVTPESAAAQNAKIPAIVGAISTSNTAVYVSFSKSMGDSAVDARNYVITQENINAEVGTLIIKSVSFPVGDTEHTSVILETSPQNEVTYRVQVSAIKDADGNPIIGVVTVPGGTIDTSSVTFAGSAPSQVDLVIVNDGVGGISGWVDVNGNGVIDAGDSLSDSSGNNIILTDFNGDGVIDNWIDTDGGGTVTAGDIVSGFQDTDGDGLTDSQELYGENIYIEKANGEVVVFTATSDPTKADTDGDGLNDLEELNIGTNPRNTDTDGDGISDYTEWNVVYSNTNMQDSDLDGLIDGLEHNFYHTSPLLADSDGDQLSDSAELLELNRNPRIADLPALNISVGEMRLQIDERYSYTDESGKTVTQESSTNTTLSSSTNRSFSKSDTTTDEFTGGSSFGFEVGSGRAFGSDSSIIAGKAIVSGNVQRTQGTVSQVDSASAAESQRAYESSLSKGREFSTTSTVSREVIGARIDVDISIKNNGNVPFTVSNIEITVLQQNPADPTGFLPVATLVSNSQLITGTSLQVNLGAFTLERGPFLFSSSEVFPNLVEALMRKPSGLIFRIANYDVTDELGRNYTFINQVARDRTASITLDFGDAAAAKNYLVATNGAIDDENVAGGGYLGGFSSTTGSSLSLPLSYILQNIMQIPRQDTTLDQIVAGTDGTLQSGGANLKGDDIEQNINGVDVVTAGPNGWLETRPIGDDFVSNPAIANSIIAGLNKTAESIAQGDDIQLVPAGTTGLSIGTVVISPGADNVLDTSALPGDAVSFANGYETARSCSAVSNKAGDICRIDTDCACQPGDELNDGRCMTPVFGATNSCSGPEKLVRVNTLSNGDFNRAWVIFSSVEVPAAADFNQIKVEAGQNMTLAFLQDLDRDGVFARQEFINGSTDSSSDKEDNDSFGETYDANNISVCLLPPPNCDGKADSRDTDRDGLDDFAEIYVGWKVAADGGALKQVFSSPRFRDTDSDGLLDPVEQDLRRFCDSPADYRSVALCSFQSEAVVLSNAIGIIAGPDGIAQTTADALDVQLTAVGSAVTYGTPVVGPGSDGILTTALVGDDLYESSSSIPPATDPTSSDTDLDAISDFTELTGFAAGLAVIDGGNGIAETEKNGDDIQRAFIDNPVKPGSVLILPGQNSIIDSVPEYGPRGGDDEYGTLTFTSLSIPAITCGANNISETIVEGDDTQFHPPGTLCEIGFGGAFAVVAAGALDTTPNNLNRDDIIRPAATGLVSDPLRRDTDDDKFADGLELSLGSNPTVSDAGDFLDSDLDGLTDQEESELGWLVSVDGGAPFLVKSGPSLPDTDFDGLPDFVERDLRTNPNNPDTDGDGISDYDEVNDLSKYVTIAALYPNLNIVATTTSGYGTNPTLSDTDGDSLSDYVELIAGNRILLPGDSLPTLVFTSALYADSDIDGLNDYEEIFTYKTNPNGRDSDGDNRDDGSEILAGTNPLEKDIGYRINVRSISADNGCDDGGAGDTHGELMWWFILSEPNSLNKHLISDALDMEKVQAEAGVTNEGEGALFMTELVHNGVTYPARSTVPSNPIYTENIRGCYYKALNPSFYWMNIDKRSNVFALKPGQNINLGGMLIENDTPDAELSPNCGLPGSFVPLRISSDHTSYVLNKSYSFDDLVGGGIINLTNADAKALVGSSTSCKLDFQIDIEVIQ